MNSHFEQQVIIVDGEEQKKESKHQTVDANDKNREVALVCSTCGITFEMKEAFKEHYKAEIHIENVKRKMKGDPIYTEEEFQRMKEEEFD